MAARGPFRFHCIRRTTTSLNLVFQGVQGKKRPTNYGRAGASGRIRLCQGWCLGVGRLIVAACLCLPSATIVPPSPSSVVATASPGSAYDKESPSVSRGKCKSLWWAKYHRHIG